MHSRRAAMCLAITSVSLASCSQEATHVSHVASVAPRPARPAVVHALPPAALIEAPVAALQVALPPAAPPPRRVCGQEAWSTYAHDAARTSTSDGCIEGPLAITWTFSPAPFAGRSGHIHHAIAERDAVFAVGLRGQSPVLHRIDPDGKPRWTFDSRADIHRADWPTDALGWVLVNDDGFYLVDRETGKHEGRGLDQWGPQLTDGERLYLTNTLQVDGPGFFLAAYDAEGKTLWKRDKFRGVKMAMDEGGGLCLDGGVVFHAASYHFASHSSVSAWVAASGDKRWSVQTTPVSGPAASNGKIFTIERNKPAMIDTLVARAQEDGAVAWSRAVAGTQGQSPVVAGRLVVVHGDAGVVAFDAASGERVWSSPIARTKVDVGAATSLAAAMGSKTLVVTSGDRAHVLGLADGARQWDAVVAGGREVHSPSIVGHTLYVVAGGALVRLDAAADGHD